MCGSASDRPPRWTFHPRRGRNQLTPLEDRRVGPLTQSLTLVNSHAWVAQDVPCRE